MSNRDVEGIGYGWYLASLESAPRRWLRQQALAAECTQSEEGRMVLGRSRPRLRADGSRLFAVRNTPIALQPAHSWTHERGSTLFTAGVEVLGGFPGYADRGCLLTGAQLRITDRYLLVDEGQPQGFGLPIDWLDGTVLVEMPGRDDYAVRVFYRAGGCSRLFTLKFRGGRVGGRGGRKSMRAQDALHTAGSEDRYAEHPPLEPAFTLPWDQTREFEHENVIWTGRASAPIRVGAESAPSEVWLTTKSLIWGSGDGEGINRIPLPLLMDLVSTRLRDRIGTPVIYVAIGDETTGRYELPFAFDLHTPTDRNFRERGAFLVGLRSRGLGDGVAASYSQPWRSTLLSVDDDEHSRAVSRLFAREAPEEIEEREQLDAEQADELIATDLAGEADLDDPDLVEPEAPQRSLPRLDNISHISEIFERRRTAARLARSSEQRTPTGPLADEPLPAPTFLRADLVFDLEVTPSAASGPNNQLLAAYTEIAAQVPHRANEPSDVISSDASQADQSVSDVPESTPGISVAQEVVVFDTALDRDEPREDQTERFAVLAPLQPAAQDDRGKCPSGDLVLAEWSAGHDTIEVDVALSERWISQPESSTLDSDPNQIKANQAEIDDPEGTTSRSTEPPGWWPEFGREQAASEPDRIVESEAMPLAGEDARHDAEELTERPSSEPERERLIASSTLSPEADEWPAVRCYEESAVGALSDVLRVINARVRGNETILLAERAPASWEQARALAELTEMVNQGAIAAEDARHRRERLITLGEVCVRLRTLVELHANGILAADQLDAKRVSLLQGLTAALARQEAAE